MIERLNREIRRRTSVVGIFPNESSYVRLVTTYLMEYAEDWSVSRAYLSQESIAATLTTAASPHFLRSPFCEHYLPRSRRAAEKRGARGFQPSSWICTSKSVACQTIPHFFFSINKTRSTQLNFKLCAPGFIAWIGVHKNVQKFMSVFAIKGCIPFVRGLFLFSR